VALTSWDKKIPSHQEGPIFIEAERSELTKRGAFFNSPLPTVYQRRVFACSTPSYSHGLARYLIHSLRSAPSYRTVVRLRKPRPAGGRAGMSTNTQNVAPMGRVNPTRMAGDDHHLAS